MLIIFLDEADIALLEISARQLQLGRRCVRFESTVYQVSYVVSDQVGCIMSGQDASTPAVASSRLTSRCVPEACCGFVEGFENGLTQV